MTEGTPPETSKAIETLAEIAERFNSTTSLILAELKAIRIDMTKRPTGSEQAMRRRMAVLALLLLGWCALMANENHVSTCSPGARAATAIDYVSKTPPKDFSNEHLRNLLRKPLPGSCDVTYPTRAHEYGEDWPTQRNLIGLGIYLAILIGLYLWAQAPARRED